MTRYCQAKNLMTSRHSLAIDPVKPELTMSYVAKRNRQINFVPYRTVLEQLNAFLKQTELELTVTLNAAVLCFLDSDDTVKDASFAKASKLKKKTRAEVAVQVPAGPEAPADTVARAGKRVRQLERPSKPLNSRTK